MKITISDIRSTYEGFARLSDLAHQLQVLVLDDIEIDMSRASWIDANMCAPFGAILYKAARDLNDIRISNINSSLETILSNNGFLNSYGYKTRKDTNRTTIEYKRFEPKDDRYFASYIETHLVGKDLPEMSAALMKKFRESIYEIFSNAVIHSRTELGIFSCGQYFPNRYRLDFTIVDLGRGIPQTVREEVGLDLSPGAAISWALEGKNTTKKGAIPGGLGLKLLRNFIIKNEGKIQIASDHGYWELFEGQIRTETFSHSFPGTAVNIEINTADAKSYRLATEIKPEDVF